MKLRWNYLLVLLVIINAQVQGQNRRVYIGSNGSSFSKPSSDLTYRVGLGYQVGADIQLGKKKFFIQPGVQYSSAHVGLLPTGQKDTKSDLWVSGLKIPVFFGYRKVLLSSANLRVFTGPSFMMVTKVAHKNRSDTSFVFTDKNYHDVEWAWHLGAGIDIQHFFIDAGFQKGLTYVFTEASNAKSNVFYLNLGLRF